MWNDIRKIAGVVKKTYQGTYFVGRVLLSMTVSPNDDPETGPSRAAPYREPLAKLHVLRVTIYELKNVLNTGDQVKIVLRIGSYKRESNKSSIKESENG